MKEKRKRPDPLPVLIVAHRRALAQSGREPNEAVFLIGKSMGGRIGCHVALEEKVTGVICLGYPLCGAGDRTKMRDQVLRQLRTPILFVQGTRDPLCPLDLLETLRAGMTAPNRLHTVPGGDHSLIVAKRHLAATGENQPDIDRQILKAVAAFVGQLPNGDEL